MLVFLMRHAEAEPGEPDAARPLTVTGRRQARRAGRGPFAVAAAVAPLVEHSGLVRSVQTAELAMRAAGVAPRRLRLLAGLAPEDDPVVTARLLATARRPRLIVGHNPHLASLLALLLGARSGEAVRFRKGAVAALERIASPSRGAPHGRWRLRWFVPPVLA
ncbi:MAG: histidine phosphatase family protein [Verrucomicrobiota bacterium]